MFTNDFIEEFKTRVRGEGALSILIQILGWKIVGLAGTGDVHFNWHKFRLVLVEGVSADIWDKRAALTCVALQVSGLTYSLDENPADEVRNSYHIYVRVDDTYWCDENIAKYGVAACKNRTCRYRFDDWTTPLADGGVNTKRLTVSHPLQPGMYRVCPCSECPMAFKKEFAERQVRDEARAAELKYSALANNEPDSEDCIKHALWEIDCLEAYKDVEEKEAALKV
jgi:hypothetical protein